MGRGTERYCVALCQMEPGWKGTESDLLSSIKRSCSDLASYEVPKAVRVVGEMSVENGCLTPTLKVVRRKVERLYEAEVRDMYEGGRRPKL